MEPITAGIALVSALAPSIGALIGNLFGAGDREKAQQMLDQALQQYAGISLPDLQKLPPSELAKLAPDSRLKDAQYHALDKMQEMEQGGGFTLEDQAALNKIQTRVGQQTSGDLSAIRENMSARGVGGSGAELALSLGAQQAGANRVSQAGTDTAAQAQRRYFDSILQRGKMAGQVRGQEYDEKSDAARANDLINRYNAVDRPQAQFGNSMRLADARSDVYRARAGDHAKQADRSAATGYGIGQGIADAGNSYLKYDAAIKTANALAAQNKPPVPARQSWDDEDIEPPKRMY